jgi:hypothetical protein
MEQSRAPRSSVAPSRMAGRTKSAAFCGSGRMRNSSRMIIRSESDISARGARGYGLMKSTIARFASQLRRLLVPPASGIPPLPDLKNITQTKLSLFHDGKDAGALRFEMYLGPPDNPRYVKEPSGRATIPWEIYHPLGRITAIWGQFEVRMDLLTQLIGVATKTTPSQVRNFNKRKEQCRSCIKSYFAIYPDIVSFLDETLALAAQMHWRRNLLVHGEISTIATWIVGGELRFGLKASGRHNGKDITLEFYPDDFDQLYGNLAHCYGRFDFLTGREVNNPLLSSQDRQILLDFVVRNLPNLPTPSMLAHQPPP